MTTTPTCKPGGAQLLHLQRDTYPLGVVIRVFGEIDLSSHLRLRTELFDACESVEPPAPVVLDLTGVEFLASVGLSELLLCNERAIARGTPLRVVASERHVLRPIEVTGLDRLLSVHPNVDAALNAA
jgi:anti-sigma B factor antagonist